MEYCKEKPYYSKSLEKVLSQYINGEIYGYWTPILKEIFQRRAYEYNFSDKFIEKEVKNFVKNLTEIEFAPSSEMFFNGKEAMGLYISEEKMIKLNQDYFLALENALSIVNFGQELFGTLTHEVYHAINDTPYGIGLSYYNYKGQLEGIALDEIANETAANRTSISRTDKDVQNYRAQTTAYSDITFVTNLLAASLGCTEREFLRHSKNRKVFNKFFYSKFTSIEAGDFAYEMFSELESSLDTIYNINYSENNIKTFEEKKSEDELFISSLVTLYSKVFGLEGYQIYQDTRELSSEYISEIQYRFLKINKIMTNSLSFFQNIKYDISEIKENAMEKTFNIRSYILMQLIELHTLFKEQYKIKDKNDFNILVESAKSARLEEQQELLDKYGIIIPQITYQKAKSINGDSKYINYVMREDFDNGKQWDNLCLVVGIKEDFDRIMQQKGLKVNNDPIKLIPIENKSSASYYSHETNALDKNKRSTYNSSLFLKVKKIFNYIINESKNTNLKNSQIKKDRIINNEIKEEKIDKFDTEFDRRYKVNPKRMNKISNSGKTGAKKQNRENNSKNDNDRQN